MLAAWLAIALGAIMIAEQPASSLLARHPRFQELCDAHKAMCFHAGRHATMCVVCKCSIFER